MLPRFRMFFDAWNDRMSDNWRLKLSQVENVFKSSRYLVAKQPKLGSGVRGEPPRLPKAPTSYVDGVLRGHSICA